MIAMAESGNQGGSDMWPSEATAALIYTVANIVLIASLAIGVLATVLVVWTGSVKEEYSRRSLAAVNDEAAEAKSELEKYKAPRSITDAQATAIIPELKEFRGQNFAVLAYAGEPLDLANRLSAILQAAGWQYIPRNEFLVWGIENVDVWTSGDADAPVKQAADALCAELRKAGLIVTRRDEPLTTPKNDRVNISIGSKHR